MGKTMRKIIFAGSLIVAMSGCQATYNDSGEMGPKQGAGALSGAIIGGVIGDQIGNGSGNRMATALGVFTGTIIGAGIGETLDRIDREYMLATQQRALEIAPSNTALEWVNPDTGNSGYTTPMKVYSQGSLQCREYTTVVNIGGVEQQAYGKACRMSDGSWEIQS